VAAVLRVHQSNYRIVGFTEAPTVAALAALAPPLIVDIGSGLLDAACPWLPHGPPNWLRDEPAARQTLAGGAALVTFSGDKLLGGPQAGIIAGRADLVARVARHPLARALRPGGLVMASLQQLALTYLRRDGDAIPFWLMATRSTASLRARAEAVVPPGGRIVATASVPGGGTLPGIEIASVGIELDGDHTAALRKAPTPIIARMTERGTTLDLRTVEPTDDEYVGRVLAALAEN
jgi:L-seryl-tRNA(Ser) seleniumtransferase